MKTVHLEQPIKKLGNSSGVIIPAATMRELGIEINDIIELDITPKQKNPQFNIEGLMANTDFEEQRQDADLKDWETRSAIGRELV